MEIDNLGGQSSSEGEIFSRRGNLLKRHFLAFICLFLVYLVRFFFVCLYCIRVMTEVLFSFSLSVINLHC